jgi:hypothetical protein
LQNRNKIIQQFVNLSRTQAGIPTPSIRQIPGNRAASCPGVTATLLVVVLELNPCNTTKRVMHTTPCVSLLEGCNFTAHTLYILGLMWEVVRNW